MRKVKRPRKSKGLSPLARRLREALKPWREHPDVVKLGILEAQAQRLLPKTKPGSRQGTLLKDIIWRISIIRQAVASGDTHQAVNHTMLLMQAVADAGLSLEATRRGRRAHPPAGILCFLKDQFKSAHPHGPGTLWDQIRRFGTIQIKCKEFVGHISYEAVTRKLVQVADVKPGEPLTYQRIKYKAFERHYYDVKRSFSIGSISMMSMRR